MTRLDPLSMPLLIAQQVEAQPVGSGRPWLPGFGAGEVMVIAVLSGVLLLVGVVAYWAMRQARLERQMEHAERMRALELGQRMPGDLPWWTPAKVAVAIGAGVPLGSFGVALAATTSVQNAEMVWPGACGVGVTAVICGTILALRLREPAHSPGLDLVRKPYVDPADRELSEYSA